MLNAQEATEAQRNLPYGAGETKEERAESRLAYNKRMDEINQEFTDFLADDYASDLPEAVQSAIYSKAYSESNGSGYYDLESHYSELAEFTRRVIELTA